MGDIKAIAKTGYQARDILKTFERHGVVKRHGEGRGSTYEWDVNAPPFMLGKRSITRSMKQPSSGEVVKLTDSIPSPFITASAPPASAELAREIQVVVTGNRLVISGGALAGKVRLIIETDTLTSK